MKHFNIKFIAIMTLLSSIHLYATDDLNKNTEFKLVDSSVNISANNNISINFSQDQDKNMVYGKAGCNNYFAGYTIKDNNIYINQPGSTLMYCQGKMQDEATYLDTLEKVNNYKVDNNVLDLYQDNNFLLRFQQ